MSQIEYVEHKCDVCGDNFRIAKGSSTTRKFKKVDIPSKTYDCEGRNYSRGMSTVDMCDKCFDEFWTFVNNRYDVSELLSEITVNIKEN